MTRAALLTLVAGLSMGVGSATGQEPAGGGMAGWLAETVSPEARKLSAGRRELLAESAILPASAGRDTTSRLGWHSPPAAVAETSEWVEVDLGRNWPITSVALVPASGTADLQSGPGYGFPVRFRVECGVEEEPTGFAILWDRTDADFPNPGALPVSAPGGGRRGRFIRIALTKACQRGTDWVTALGELIVLSGGRNVAVGRPVRVSRSTTALPSWAPENLTDGASLLGPPVGAEPSPTNGYLAVHERSADVVKWVRVDLGRVVPIDEVRLFPARPTDFPDMPGEGFPQRFRIESAEDSDFANPNLLYESADDFSNPGDNFVSVDGSGRRGRWVRATATRLRDRGGTCSFSLAELQVWSEGRNVALGAPVSAFDVFENPRHPRWRPEYLVDGYNSRRAILDLPDWLAGLERRRQLNIELETLDRRSVEVADAVLVRVLAWGGGGAGLTLVLAATLILRTMSARRRELEGLRRRIAADLHDEIGSQLASIALSAELAGRGTLDADASFAEIAQMAREATDALRDIVWLLKPGSATLAELLARLRESAASGLHSCSWSFSGSDTVVSGPISFAFARNVHLIVKEALANGARHARPTRVRIETTVSGRTLVLRIHDDGVGFDPKIPSAGDGLRNMRRRAADLGGTLDIVSAPGAGTTVTLKAPIR